MVQSVFIVWCFRGPKYQSAIARSKKCVSSALPRDGAVRGESASQFGAAGTTRRRVYNDRVSIHVALNHVTHYRYDRLVALGPQIVRLRPAPHCRTRILSYSLKVTPAKHFINWQQDPQANYLARFVFPEQDPGAAHRGGPGRRDGGAQPVRLLPRAVRGDSSRSPTRARQQRELAPYLVMLPRRAAVRRVPAPASRASRERTIDFLVELNCRLSRDITLPDPHGAGRADARGDAARTRSGSCRDSAWLLVQLLRHLGLAARFVSGYLIQLTPDVKSLDGPSGPEKDFTDLHAWCEVYLPGARLDRPRSDLRPARRRRPHSAGLHARARSRPRRSPAPSTRPRSSSNTT